MIFWLSVSMMPIIISFLFKNLENKKNAKNFLIVCGVILILIFGFRDRLAGSLDTNSYCLKFETMLQYSDFFEYLNTHDRLEKGFLFSEIGFWFSTWVISRVFSNAIWFVFITTAFIIWGTLRFIYKNSDNVLISLEMFITLGLFTFVLNGMRQALAMTICLFAYEFAKKRKLLPFLLVVLLAVLFHKSAVFFLVVYFVPSLKFKFKSVFVFSVLSVGVIYYAQELMQFADEILDKSYAEKTTETGGFAAIIIYFIIIIIGFVMVCNKVETPNAVNALYLSMLATIFFLMRYFVSAGYERISYYFMYFLIILFPSELIVFDKKSQKIASVVFIVMYIMLFVYRMRSNDFAFCF